MTNAMQAKAFYTTMCKTLDALKWTYDREDADLVIRTNARGKDLKIDLLIRVDADRMVGYIKSRMPFDVKEEKRDLFCKAINVANYSMLNGCFEMDPDDGYFAFKLVVPFMDSLLSNAVCNYMVLLVCQMVDKFNDKFLALHNDTMTLSEFVRFTKAD